MEPRSPTHDTEHPARNGQRPVFVERGFNFLLRTPSSDLLQPTDGNPEVTSFDAVPDTATAWAHGLYATLVGRLPQKRDLIATANRIRSGTTPGRLVEDLLGLTEEEAAECDYEADLGTVFITGCYLCVLGRRPDPAGLEQLAGVYASGVSPDLILHGFLESEEASSSMRFPAIPLPESMAIGQAIQAVVLGIVPAESLTHELAIRYMAGEPVGAMVRELIDRDRPHSANAESDGIIRKIASQILVDAKLRQLKNDAASDREWERRRAQSTWTLLGEVRAELGSIRAALSEIERRLASEATAATDPGAQ